MAKQTKKRRRGRPEIGSTQLTPRLHPDELQHLDSIIAEHAKRARLDEPLGRHDAIRRLVRKATAKQLVA